MGAGRRYARQSVGVDSSLTTPGPEPETDVQLTAKTMTARVIPFCLLFPFSLGFFFRHV